MMTLDEQFEDVYGPMPRYSDHKKGEHISYHEGRDVYTGEVLWVAGPGNFGNGCHVPTHYVVQRDGTGDTWPDTVFQSDIVAALEEGHEADEPAMVHCPYC